MTWIRGENGLNALIQITEKVTYATFDVKLSKPALFKVISNDVLDSDDAKVDLADGSTVTMPALLLDAMNALVIKVYDTGSDVLITEFGLFR